MKSNVTYVRPPLLLTFLFLFSTTILSNIVNAQRQNLIMENTFEGSNPWSGFQYGYQFCCNYSVTQSTTVARAGTSSTKFDLRSSDPIVSSSLRAEIEPQTTDQQEMERWYGLSYYLVNYGSDNGAESILQWHDVDGSCPPLSLQVQGGRLRIQQCINGSNTPNDIGPVVSNQWFDIVMHVKWTTTNTGIIQVWKDGVLVVDKSNIRTNSSGGSYMKVGINKWSWAPPLVGTSSQTQRVFYIDEFRMGNQNATYADVAPSSTAPPPGNQSPAANAGNDITLTLPANSTTLSGTGTDPDGTIASYAWSRVSGPTTFSLSNASAANTTLSNLVQGTYVFKLTVTDNGGATATDNINVIVNAAPNQSPTANAGNDITLTLPANSTTLSGTGTDPDGTIASYAWSRVSGPTTFTLANANAATTALSNLVQGTYVFKLTVTDNGGATATDNINVIVNAAPNQSPTANAGNDITLTLPTNSTTLSGTGTDPDGTIASYAWSRVSGPTTFALANANAATTALSNLVQGTYVFKLTVTDNSGATATDNINVIVNAAPPANQPPVANAGSDITITLPANTATLQGSATDADGTISGYAWSMISGPATYTVANASAATTGISNLVQGTYVFSFTATDNNGATGIDYVTVTVNAAPTSPNQSPAANAGNDITLTLPANSTTLNGSGIDPDGTISAYAWSKISGPASFTLGNAASASTALSNLVQGIYVFRLTVTDNNGATASAFVTITVNAAPPPPNQAPTANAGNDITLTLPANSTTLNGSGSSDPDGTISTYAWSKISGPATYTVANAGAVSTALSNLVQGVYVFSLTVTDNNGATGIDYITVTVNAAPPPPNQPPVAHAGNDITLTLPTNATTLNGSTSTDADGTITSYAWSRVSGPTTYAFANASAATTALNSLVQGVYVFRLTVTDNNGATGIDDITVTVNAAPVPNQPPVAHAGNDIVMTLPTNSTTLNGSTSTDADGTITTYAWSRVSGPTYTIANAGAATTTISNLQQGIYIMRLTVTDNSGASATDDVTITVNAAVPPPPTTNEPPVANAGTDVTLMLPVNGTTLYGTNSTDPDGVIASYEWQEIAGPTQLSMPNRVSSSLQLADLMIGEYTFELKVTDNRGATATARVRVIVKTKSGEGLYCNVFPNPTNSTLNIQYSGNNTGKVRIYVYDAMKRYMLGETVSKDLVTMSTSIDVSKYQPGTYFLEIVLSGNKKIVRKFVKL